MPYEHIKKEERIKIEGWLRADHPASAISRFLGRDPGTISRELARGRDEAGRYRASLAERRRRKVRRVANQERRKILPGSSLAAAVEAGLKKYWSPEQVAGRLKRQHRGRTVVCHETIYRYLYAERKDLMTYLRCQKGRYRRRRGTRDRAKQREESKKKRIDTRPKVIEKRSRLGDWEGDTIVGKEKSQHILTHVDRKSGLLLADKVTVATAEEVSAITIRRFRNVAKKKRLTVTYDNGVQFAAHEVTERDAEIDVYFAYPYHSWERGTNENTNGLLRQFFPKGSPFATVTQRCVANAVARINHRPRKRHHYLTPAEVFSGRSEKVAV